MCSSKGKSLTRGGKPMAKLFQIFRSHKRICYCLYRLLTVRQLTFHWNNTKSRLVNSNHQEKVRISILASPTKMEVSTQAAPKTLLHYATITNYSSTLLLLRQRSLAEETPGRDFRAKAMCDQSNRSMFIQLFLTIKITALMRVNQMKSSTSTLSNRIKETYKREMLMGMQ